MTMHPFATAMTGCALLLAAGLAAADPITGLLEEYRQVREQGRASHVVDIDNDTLLLNRRDGLYSSGLRYTQIHTRDDRPGTTAFGWRFGQELYTASDIKLPPESVGPPDHPYAGWLYGGFFRERTRADGTHDRIGIDIGCLGPCAGGEWTQTRFHRILDQPLPRGWSRQMRNEAGVVLYGELAPLRWTPHPSVDATPVFGARLGNIFTDASAGLLFRVGQLEPSPTQSRLHAYLRVDLKAVAYNATLQGGYFSRDNPHTVEPKRLVGGAEAGLAWRRNPFAVTVAFVRRGNEIKDLPNSAGAQNYLRLQLVYTP